LVRNKKCNERDYNFAKKVYLEIAESGVYITNLAKCTQTDARPLKNKIFKEYLPIMEQEIKTILPQRIFTLGNQVSSVLLNKRVSVNDYKDLEKETLFIQGTKFDVYPVYYPIGQGQKSSAFAEKRIKKVLRL
jgi:uracil-DNA glycosylase family 4